MEDDIDYGNKLNPFDNKVVGQKGTGKYKSIDKQKKVETIVQEKVPGKFGYLRNMLINTKLLKQAFGVSGDFTVESINVIEAIESLFSLLIMISKGTGKGHRPLKRPGSQLTTGRAHARTTRNEMIS